MIGKRSMGLLVVLLLSHAITVFGQSRDFSQGEAPLISPPSEMKQVKEAKIDKEYIEIVPYYGLYAVEGFNSSAVYGARFALHLTEDFFFEGNYGVTKADLEAFSVRTGLTLLTDDDVIYWNINLGYNIFPGQVFLTRSRTLNSTIFLVGGVGQTEFDAQDRFTFNIGSGYKIFFTDWLDAGFRLAIHSFETDITGVKDRIFNMEGTVNIAFFF